MQIWASILFFHGLDCGGLIPYIPGQRQTYHSLSFCPLTSSPIPLYPSVSSPKINTSSYRTSNLYLHLPESEIYSVELFNLYFCVTHCIHHLWIRSSLLGNRTRKCWKTETKLTNLPNSSQLDYIWGVAFLQLDNLWWRYY